MSYVDRSKARKAVAHAIAHEGSVSTAAPVPKPALPKLVGHNGESIRTAEVQDAQPIVEGLIYCGAAILSGRPKQGKSWLTLALAIGVASGTPIGGQLAVQQPGRVLYLALEESPNRTTRRMRKLTGLSEYLRDITFVYRDEIEAATNGGLIQLEEYLKTHPGIRLVVIDTLLAFFRLERHSSRDLLMSDYNQIQPLVELATKYECAIVIVHHSRKAGGDAIDVVAGSTGTTAAPDSIMTLQRQPDGSSLLTVISRDMEEMVYQMRLNNTDEAFGWEIIARGDEARSSEQRRDVIELLRDEALKPNSPCLKTFLLEDVWS